MKQSTIPSPSSDVEKSSDRLAGAVKQRLGWLCRHRAEHVRFLNTLCLMEHIGSRKIMASQTKRDPSGDTLRHLAEETRHAFFFKHAAEKLARRPLGYGAAETIAGPAARFYMGRLDASIARDFNGKPASPLPYLYMSLIVELRAVWFYQLYQEALSEHGQDLSLRSVLAEEELHLSAMLARLTDMDPDCTSRVTRFRALERQRFGALWGAVEAECNGIRLAGESTP
jgi:hypothetical protein